MIRKAWLALMNKDWSLILEVKKPEEAYIEPDLWLPNFWHLASEKRDRPLQQVGSSVSTFTKGGHNCPDSRRL
ncbi:unnamed protein product [Sphagnum compactum]